MPAYDLICGNCGHKMEVIHGLNEKHPKKCPSCGKMKLRQDWSTPPAYHNHFSPLHPRKNRGRGY